MENISNSELLYDVIDSLSDEEFSELIHTLAIDDEKVKEVKTESEEISEKLKKQLQKRIADFKAANTRTDKTSEIREKLEANRKRKEVKEKLENARKRKEIRETLESARKRKAIKEKLENARKAKVTESSNDGDQLRSKIIEKLNVSRKKKMIQERVKQIKSNK